MKRSLFVVLFSILTAVSFANHTKGGWMYYEYLGPGVASNSSIYRITLKLYSECNLSPGQIDATVPFTIFSAANNAQLYNISVGVISDINTNNCTSPACHPCINNIPYICYKIRTYQTSIELPNTTAGYIVSYQRCCRISGIRNIQAPSNNYGETWTVKIPGTAIPLAQTNSSAWFSQNDTAIICEGGSFTFDFSATDINNDSLVYAFTPAFGGGGQSNANPPTCSTCPSPNPSTPPPFSSIPYAAGFSGTLPLGSGVTINSSTGMVTGFGPPSGIYVITVTVSEYKRGTNIKIAEVRKSLHIEVTNCTLTEAKLDPQYLSCDGFTLDFFNLGSNNIQTYYWDFGDGDTSTLPAPTHTYADTGIY
ncbi:MAG: PKD domain-containing protein, partial [Ferruginibacter sp.]